VRAEDILMMANAHGVDLMRIAKNMTSDDPEVMQAARDVVKKRFGAGRTAFVLVPPPDSMAAGKETRTAKRPEWTTAELAQAAAGVPELSFRAALFAFAGDHKYYKWLRSELFHEALQLREQLEWPPVIVDLHDIEIPYLNHLAALVLDEDAHPSLFRVAPQLYALYMRVPEKTWDKAVSRRFHALKVIWTNWGAEALRMIQPRLKQHEEAV